MFFIPGFVDGLATESITAKNKVHQSTTIIALYPIVVFLVYKCRKSRNAQTDDIAKNTS